MNNFLAQSDYSIRNIEANRIYHDYIAKRYESDPRVRLGVMHPNCGKRLEWLKKMYFCNKKEISALNVGVGTGNLMKRSEKIFNFIFGLDISLNMLKQAKRFTDKLVCGDAFRMPLRPNSVDIVFCIAVLHHIYDLEYFFRSSYEILKQGGVFYSDYDPNKKFYQTIAKVPFLSFLLYSYKKISDKFIFTKKDKKLFKNIHDMAEYHEEFCKGLEPENVSEIARKVGFSDVRWICHSDSRNLDYPKRGRLVHKLSEFLLMPFSKTYTERAKLFSLIAVK